MTAFATAMELYDKGKLRDALPYFGQALREEPHDVEVMYRAMLALMAMRDYAGAARWLEQLQPHVNPAATPSWMMAGLHYNHGISFEACGEWASAKVQYEAALKYEPNAIMPKIELGSIAYRLGNPDEGQRWHREALAPEIIDPESRPARSYLRLLYGDYRGGFAEYESRWKLPQILAQSFVPKGSWRWKGKPLNGDKILVVCEQGMGDTLMMARYIPELEAMAGRVTFLVQPGLVRLMEHSFPSITVLGDREKVHPPKWWIPTMSLPLVMDTTVETIPRRTVPYLRAPEKAFNFKPGFRVGYVARGNPLFMGDKDRSTTVETFAPLLDTPGCTFIHLDEFTLKEEYGCQDFADTASLVGQLDLVITVDSSVGHCAGALGVPTWILVPCAPEWRHGLGDEHPWYPTTHRIFRRRDVNDWPAVIERVRRDLLAEIS